MPLCPPSTPSPPLFLAIPPSNPSLPPPLPFRRAQRCQSKDDEASFFFPPNSAIGLSPFRTWAISSLPRFVIRSLRGLHNYRAAPFLFLTGFHARPSHAAQPTDPRRGVEDGFGEGKRGSCTGLCRNLDVQYRTCTVPYIHPKRPGKKVKGCKGSNYGK